MSLSRADLETIARNTAAQYGVPVELVFGVIQTESAWNPNASSWAGAKGLMQLMPKTFAGLGFNPGMILDPATNVSAGVKYLSQMLKRYSGSWALAAMAYNGGPGTVDAAILRANSHDPQAVSNQIRAAETKAYWVKVLNWAGVVAGKMTAAEARVQNAAVTVSSDVFEWAHGTAGKSVLLLLAAGSLALLFRGLRG
jgi:soluble lytic murein transglycosylase-like protein